MRKLNIDFIGKSNYALAFSILLSIISIILLFYKGLNLSIDFNGGTVINFYTHETNVESELKTLLIDRYGDFEVQKIHSDAPVDHTYVLRLGNTTSDSVDLIISKLKSNIQDIEIIKIDYIGPKVGAEFTVNAFKAITLSLIAMMLYVWWRFNFKFGIGVILALLHDVLITLGFFSATWYQFDLTSIAVILTVVGYSINDSIVIYDRIRENILVQPRMRLHKLINQSINETLSRTIMTSFTTIIVCLALLFFGGEALHSFSAGLSFGIAFGTYSSIYISAPVLLLFKHQK